MGAQFGLDRVGEVQRIWASAALLPDLSRMVRALGVGVEEIQGGVDA